MDWEKQDNELRNLMEGSGFLPDSEAWDDHLMWKKLQQKRQSVRRRYLPVSFRLAAAACISGLIGIGLWTIISSSFFTKDEAKAFKKVPAKSLVGNGEAKPSGKSKINENLSLDPSEAKAVSKPPVPGKTQVKYEKNFPKKPDDLMLVQKGTTIETEGQVNPETPLENNGALTAGIIEPAISNGSPKIEPQPTGTPPAQAVKLRVVHYNMLNANTGTPPPVFVKKRKPEPEWDYVVGRASEPSTHPSPQLKIDISPAPKKTL